MHPPPSQPSRSVRPLPSNYGTLPLSSPVSSSSFAARAQPFPSFLSYHQHPLLPPPPTNLFRRDPAKEVFCCRRRSFARSALCVGLGVEACSWRASLPRRLAAFDLVGTRREFIVGRRRIHCLDSTTLFHVSLPCSTCACAAALPVLLLYWSIVPFKS